MDLSNNLIKHESWKSMKNKTNIYLGAPLFSNSERLYNSKLEGLIKEAFRDEVDLYVPQNNEAINDKSGYADSKMIAAGDNEYLEKTDILIAILDGPVIDPGLASEIGYFYSMKKPILGLYTDSRQGTHDNQDKISALDEIGESQFSYVNLYTLGLIKLRGTVVNSEEGLIKELKNLV